MRKAAGSGSAINECRSSALMKTVVNNPIPFVPLSLQYIYKLSIGVQISSFKTPIFSMKDDRIKFFFFIKLIIIVLICTVNLKVNLD